jgi:hypothetical protein
LSIIILLTEQYLIGFSLKSSFAANAENGTLTENKGELLRHQID